MENSINKDKIDSKRVEVLDNIMDNFNDISDKALERSKETIDNSITIAKKYPVHTAIGVGALGFIAGALTNKLFK